VREVAQTLELTEFLGRRPAVLSGGQRQRVALGRAIVRSPRVFLLDEPLSNLDAKLRLSMRTEIAKLQRSLRATMIYVTHDQIEAMTLGHRIVVLDRGVIQQIDTPMRLYAQPSNLFVAGFFGSPAMNFLRGTLYSQSDAYLACEDRTIDLGDFLRVNPQLTDRVGKTIVVGIPGTEAYSNTLDALAAESGVTNPDAPRIACYDEEAFVYGEVALVLCEEELEGGTLAASNFFVREDGVWRIAHHQAGQIVRRQAERRRPSRLN